MLRSPRGHAGARAGRRVDPITSATPTPTIAATTPRRGNDAHEPTASATGDHHGQKWENIKMRPRDATPTPPCLQPAPPYTHGKNSNKKHTSSALRTLSNTHVSAGMPTAAQEATWRHGHREQHQASGATLCSQRSASARHSTCVITSTIYAWRGTEGGGRGRGQAGAKGTQRGSEECARRYVCDA